MSEKEQTNGSKKESNLPAVLSPTHLVLRRTEGVLGLLHDVVQESSAKYWYERGIKAKNAEIWEEGVICFSRCIDISNFNQKFYSERAHCKERLKDWEGAASDYFKALELAPTYLDYHRVASVHEVLGNFDFAQSCRQKAHELDKFQTNLFSW